MKLKKKEIHLRNKASFEQNLKDRLAALAGKGIKAPHTDKDPVVRRIQAEIRAVKRRLRAVEAQEKLAGDLAKAKAEKAAAALKAKEGPKEGGKAEKPKKAAGEQPAKEKKPKPEKKPAAPKAPEGGETPAAA